MRNFLRFRTCLWLSVGLPLTEVPVFAQTPATNQQSTTATQGNQPATPTPAERAIMGTTPTQTAPQSVTPIADPSAAPAKTSQPATPAAQPPTTPAPGTTSSSQPGPGQGANRSGRVVDQGTGTGLPGVNVAVKGTSRGVSTDAEGNFRLQAPDNAVLVFSFIGYKPQEVAVGGQTTLNVALVEDVSTLNEVVVTGYATQEKKDITSAVTVIAPKELLSVPAANLGQQLQGRAAGVQVLQDNSPGGGASIRIRGFGTLGNNNPLYVIDGVPTRENLNNLNQNDIESIQILKDATSASIYGSRAGNGVVIITTKKGKSGEPRLTFDAYYGSQQPYKYLDLLSTQEYGQYLWQSKRNAGVVNPATGNPSQAQYGNGPEPVIPDFIVPDGTSASDPRVARNPDGTYQNYSIDRFNDPRFGSSVFQITPANREGTDWLREIMTDAPIQNYNLGLTGGTEKGRYALSVGYFNQEGIIRYNGFTRYSLRANTEFTIKKRVRIGENLQLVLAQRKGGFRNEGTEGNGILMAIRMQPIVPVYDVAGNYAGTLGSNLGNAKNPVALLDRAQNNGYRDLRALGNVYAEADILDGFTLRTSFGLDGTLAYGTNYGIPEPEASEPVRTYSVRKDAQYRYSWTWTNTLSYRKTFANMHNLNAFVGIEAISAFGEYLEGFRDRYYSGAPELQYLDIGDQATQTNRNYAFNDYRLFSYFGQANYSYRDKYLLQATLRRDASSRFLAAQRYATFPAVSGGWRITGEPFMKSVPVISDLKLRAGWGQTGNQEIGDYNAYTTYAADFDRAGYSLNGNPNAYNTGFAIQRFGNPNARWETTTSINVGLDAGLFSNALEVNLDVYERKTTGLLYTRPRPATVGQGDLPAENVAAIRNRGVDLQVSYRGRAFDDKIRYQVSGNFSTYRNRVLELNPASPNEPLLGLSSRLPAVNRSVVGQPISLFYGYVIDGIFQTPEEAAAAPSFPGYNDAEVVIDGQRVRGVGKFRYRDLNNDGQITADDQTFIGNPHPDFSYGLNVSVGYGNFDLTLFGQGVSGNDLFNYVRYWTDFNTFQGNRTKDVLYNSWTPQNPTATLPILDENDAISSRASTYFIEKGSYFRMRNIQLTYSLPKGFGTRLGLSGGSIYLQTTNLFTVTKYSGLDPEITLRNSSASNEDRQLGVDEGRYPTPRQFLVGLNLSF